MRSLHGYGYEGDGVLPTPDISHISISDYGRVYEPAEDTFLLLDALEKDHDMLAALKPLACLEIGSGSGVAITFLAQLLGRCHDDDNDVTSSYSCSSLFFATDINVFASTTTAMTASCNHVTVECINTDLVTGLLPRLTSAVDIILFNPPYVVTPTEEVVYNHTNCSNDDMLVASWAGGLNGREVTDRLLPQIKYLLAPGGVLYIVVIPENKPSDIAAQLQADMPGLTCTKVLERRSGPEHLSILRFDRPRL